MAKRAVKPASAPRRSAAPQDVSSLPPDAPVPIPPRESFNKSLTSASEATMLKSQWSAIPKTRHLIDCVPTDAVASTE